MMHLDSFKHVTGSSHYIDDIPVPEHTLYAQVYYAPTAHAEINKICVDEALEASGVVDILTAEDIPGENQIGGIFPDEPLLAENSIHFWGQPLALVVAHSNEEAISAREKIRLDMNELAVTTTIKEARQNKDWLFPPITFEDGDISSGFAQSDIICEGSAESGAQEHLYLEPQGSLALPLEDGDKIKIYSSTQGPTAVQKAASSVLAMPMHAIEVEVTRLGGGFGGKEDQATPWAVLSALAAKKCNRPVKLVLSRSDDMIMTGKRHPYYSEYKIGLSSSGKILAYSVRFYQNGGAANDLSLPVLSRTLFHATNCYFIPNVFAKGYSCRTNLPPNTAFRGFGGPQGMFVIEAAIQKAAEKMGLEAWEIQEKNLLSEGDHFFYGQKAESPQAKNSWQTLADITDYKKTRAKIKQFNENHQQFQKGMAIMPICFGISFTKTPMNQAGSLVHIYQDGSVSIATGAVEMGQGVNTKIAQVAAKILGIPITKIKVESTNTTRVANTSPTAASSGSDLNGKATLLACETLKSSLIAFACRHLKLDKKQDLIFENQTISVHKKILFEWDDFIKLAYENRIPLSCHRFYATPNIFFDLKTNKGSPFAYHVYGCALTEVTIDVLRGRYEVDRIKIVHDFGKSFSLDIDKGQVEGALMQGIGWMTLEELIFSNKGKLLTNTLSTYKVPDIHSSPIDLEITELPHGENSNGLFNSKAVGEPPFMYGIGTFMALRDALKKSTYKNELPFSAPMTPEAVLRNLYGDISENH